MQFWWLPFLVAAIFLSLLLVLHHFSKNRFRDHIAAYRKSYLALVQKLEHQTLVLNRLAPGLVPEVDRRILDLYEGSLKLFENLLTLVVGISPFGQDQAVLDSAHFLQREFDDRLTQISNGLKQPHTSSKMRAIEANLKTKSFPIGCYFCSRPFVYAGLSRVKARVDGQIQQVHSCRYCKEELHAQKKVRILYFLINEKPVHWSEVKEYNPVHDFWDLRQKNAMFKPTKLELIYSRDPGDPLT